MLVWKGCTDLGKTRPINEDSYYISDYSEALDGSYAIVADGMGGHKAGEIASSMAIFSISEMINEEAFRGITPAELKDLLGRAIKKANSSIYEKSHEESAYYGMGTTLTLCFVMGDKAVVAHVGDSRAYLHRQETIHQITTDHSLVQELLRSGRITQEEAQHHPQKNVITRALGTDTDVEIDIYEFSVCAGDVLLLTTDGLTNLLSDEMIAAELTESTSSSLEEVAEKLVSGANQHGGYDNITAVLGIVE
ncbi:MAG: Stp1/IreP family PP2C-type Ser/Thr phosphatase [Clostridia bacterium]|nr:Stp1/IreP family PP2C-type Ser/Thr phosphatase [Clostridia bacterium]